MFPFWDIAIAPVIRASGARRVVEIGALRGETTARMFEQLGPDSELHVIDPLPQFDPAEHEAAFPGRYSFHRGLSHDVLPGLPAMDVALVDGDHNWFTVFHELEMLSTTARQAGQPLPILLCHDVGWPYGRRDLYYEPSRIPTEHRQPYRRAGIYPNRRKLAPKGGMNRTLANAEMEGGPRNGVMTGVDDFLATYDRPVRLVELPIYFGLAIAVETERLRTHPELTQVLDHLESPQGQHDLLVLSEQLRIDAVIFEQSYVHLLKNKISEGAEAYLELTLNRLRAQDLQADPQMVDSGAGAELARAALASTLNAPAGHLGSALATPDLNALLRAAVEASPEFKGDLVLGGPALSSDRTSMAALGLDDDRVRPETRQDTLAVLAVDARSLSEAADSRDRIMDGGRLIVTASPELDRDEVTRQVETSCRARLETAGDNVLVYRVPETN